MTPMLDYTGWIAQATAGRDKGGFFCVVGIDSPGRRVLLADGKRRRYARPKAKKLGHVKPLADHPHGFDHPAIQKLTQGEALSDQELRRALAAFRDQLEV